MSPRNRPNFNTDSGLTPIGGGVAVGRPGSAPAGTAAGHRRASGPALREFFAAGTEASSAAAPVRPGGPSADVDELVAPLGHPGLDAGVDVATVATAEPIAGVGTEASSRPGTGAAAVTGPDVEPDIVPTAGPGAQVLAAADRARAFTASPSPPAGLAAGA